MTEGIDQHRGAVAGDLVPDRPAHGRAAAGGLPDERVDVRDADLQRNRGSLQGVRARRTPPGVLVPHRESAPSDRELRVADTAAAGITEAVHLDGAERLLVE